MKLPWLAVLPLLTFSSAIAAERPPLGPSVPTEVSYRILNRQNTVPANFTVLFAPGGEKARVNFDGLPGYMLIDLSRHRMTVVMDQPKVSLEFPAPKQFAPYFRWRDTLALAEGPRDRVAGQDCRFWQAQVARGRGQVCFSDDGLPLRIEAVDKKGDHTEIEALAVARVAYDPAAFQVPADHPPLDLGGLKLSPFDALRGL